MILTDESSSLVSSVLDPGEQLTLNRNWVLCSWNWGQTFSGSKEDEDHPLPRIYHNPIGAYISLENALKRGKRSVSAHGYLGGVVTPPLALEIRLQKPNQ